MPDPAASAIHLPANLREGDVVAGRYRLERVVGAGGMGIVVAAHHVELDERVAVKFLSTNALRDPEAVARFDREIRAAARMKNEHVARVYDAGKLPDGSRYMVLEFLDGEDLAARIKRGGPLEPTLSVRYVLQACAAVQEAHGLGIIHRDLKPANLYVVQRPDGAEVVKVLDFGVMKRMPGDKGLTETQHTEPGTIVGTPYYTSPEQLRGSASVDARTDIWSLGATLYELLAGVPPFSGKTYPQIIANVLEAKPRPFGPLAATFPDGIEQVVLRCLEKEPSARYASIADFAVALADTVELDAEQKGLLERIVRHELISSPFSSPVALLTPVNTPLRFTPAAHSGTRGSPSRARALRRLLLVVGVAALSAVVVVGIGLPLLPRFEPTRTQPSAVPTVRPFTAPLPSVEPVNSAKEQSIAEPQPSTVSPTKSLRPSPTRASSKLRPKSSVTTSADEAPSTTPATQPTARKKNPLLVRPR